ncbi:hypothetical protein BDD12DRAFT_863295 [Trichophaea hybrida]|nr:hypothetical protein BDD12DRAFT_863295 [Trichophaea hybrida]
MTAQQFQLPLGGAHRRAVSFARQALQSQGGSPGSFVSHLHFPINIYQVHFNDHVKTQAAAQTKGVVSQYLKAQEQKHANNHDIPLKKTSSSSKDSSPSPPDQKILKVSPPPSFRNPPFPNKLISPSSYKKESSVATEPSQLETTGSQSSRSRIVEHRDSLEKPWGCMKV